MPPIAPDVAFALLAAGRSTRFGGDKLVAPFRGKPLWRWAADAAETAGFSRLYLVIGPHTVIDLPDGWVGVVNRAADEGMGTSIAAVTAAAAAAAHRRIVIGLADMPMMPAAHLRHIAGTKGATFTRQCDGSAGCPAGFDSEYFSALQTLRRDRGARSLGLPNVTIVDPPDPATLFDIDTAADLAAGQGPDRRSSRP